MTVPTAPVEWYDLGMAPNVQAIMQFTGLRDKNGKEIYEGDILSPSNREVRFGEFFGPLGMATGFYTIAHAAAYPEARAFEGEPFGLTSRQVTLSTVIGNIYEKPELLNGATNVH